MTRLLHFLASMDMEHPGSVWLGVGEGEGEVCVMAVGSIRITKT